MPNIFMVNKEALNGHADISGIETQMLFLILGPWKNTCIEKFRETLGVMNISARDHESERCSALVDVEMPLASIFSPDPSDSGPQLPVPAVLSSSHHRHFA